jgi:lysozyme family protein
MTTAPPAAADVRAPMTPREFIEGFISTHEGGLSLDPQDSGNYTGGKRGSGALVGSKFGVTAQALAAYRGVPATSITAKQMAALTKDEAVAIGYQNYYLAPGFDKLPWNRITASIVDKGWGSGPAQAIKLMQRMIGVTADGQLGPKTVAAYRDWLEAHQAEAWARVRIAFDTSLNQPRFLKGWNNRTNSFLPGTPWWAAWA